MGDKVFQPFDLTRRESVTLSAVCSTIGGFSVGTLASYVVSKLFPTVLGSAYSSFGGNLLVGGISGAMVALIAYVAFLCFNKVGDCFGCIDSKNIELKFILSSVVAVFITSLLGFAINSFIKIPGGGFSVTVSSFIGAISMPTIFFGFLAALAFILFIVGIFVCLFPSSSEK